MVPGASGEVSCIWDALFVCVRDLQASPSESLYFQACMERGWSPFTGPVYAPYAWLTPPNSKQGHAPYQPSAYTLDCVKSTTSATEKEFRSCVGLQDGKDGFIGSRGHSLLMQEYAYSESTFKRANLTEAGPTVFIDGSHRADLDGACWDGSMELPASCKWRLLDAICKAAEAKGDSLPAGCQHD